MPANDDEPTFISDARNTVGFLDAPRLGPDQLQRAIVEALRNLGSGSILTVYNDQPSSTTMVDELCADEAVTLVDRIEHSTGGTTHTLRKHR